VLFITSDARDMAINNMSYGRENLIFVVNQPDMPNLVEAVAHAVSASGHEARVLPAEVAYEHLIEGLGGIVTSLVRGPSQPLAWQTLQTAHKLEIPYAALSPWTKLAEYSLSGSGIMIPSDLLLEQQTLHMENWARSLSSLPLEPMQARPHLQLVKPQAA
jgi:hypothetical protein